MINTGVKRKNRSELGIALSSPRCFEAGEKTGDRIKDGVRNGIKDGGGGVETGGDLGRGLALGIRGSYQLSPQQH